MDAEETKRWKARNLRYKKPIVRNLNIAQIQEDLWEIQEACEDVRWYTDSEDGTDSLINALAGDEDEAYEFKMAFADLCAECERMQDDLQEEWRQERVMHMAACLAGTAMKEITLELMSGALLRWMKQERS